jgi:hypothetical protein
VAGCMNTIGNFGGAVAGSATGLILKKYDVDTNGVNVDGWHANFLIFAAVYGVATLCWLGFDSTKPVVPEDI